MEYDILLRKIGDFGCFQKILVLLLSLASIFNSMSTIGIVFIFGEQAHRCRIPGIPDDHYSPPGSVVVNSSHGFQKYNVTECTIEINGTVNDCDSWVYDKSVFTATIISKFDVVCDHKIYRAYFLTSHYVGLLIGSLVAGFMSDTLGRKPTLGLGIIALLITEGLRPFIPDFTIVTLMEFLNGFGSIITYIAPFILITELLGPEKRLLGTFILYITYCFSYYLLLIIAYFFRDWTHLIWIITALVGAYIIIIFFLTESPRWLLSRGKQKEAIVILKRIALMNKKDVNIDSKKIVVSSATRVSFAGFIKALLKSKTLLFRLCVISFNWFALSMTYFGLAMNVGKFAGDIYSNFAISSTAEVLSIIFCWLVADRMGHKKLHCLSMIVAGVSCISTIFTTVFGGESLSWMTVALAMAGRFFVSAAFFIVYLYTAELFPTVLRASVIGVCSMCARIGAIASAYIGELGSIIQTDFGIALPLLIFGSLGLLGGLMCLPLPETTNTVLPESVKDAKKISSINTEINVTSQELEKLAEE